MNKRILFFASDYSIGLSSLLVDQTTAFYKNGLNICAIAGEKEQEPSLSIKVNEVGIELYRITGLDEHRDFHNLAIAIKNIIIKERTTIIHVQNNWQLALITYIKYILIRNNDIKIFYTLHGFRHNIPLKSFIARIIIGTSLLLFADKVICMSHYLEKKFSLLSYKIILLPLGVSDIFFTNNCIAPLPSDGLFMIFPAQFRKGKNQDIIIRAFASYLKQTNDSTSILILPGTGPLLSSMKLLVDDLNIKSRVNFPGFCTKEEIKRLYIQCNIGIISSNSETFGQSIVEPFVLGRCILTKKVGIAPDIIQEGNNGFFFDTENDLCLLLKKISSDTDIITKIGNHNFSQRDLFRWKSICAKYENHISNL